MIVLLAGVVRAEIDHPVNYSKIMSTCLTYSQHCTYSASPLFLTIPTDSQAAPNVEHLLTLYNVKENKGLAYDSKNVTQQVQQFAQVNDYKCSCNNSNTPQPSCLLQENSSSLLWLWILLGVLALLAAAYGVKQLLKNKFSGEKRSWVPNPKATRQLEQRFDDNFVYERNPQTGEEKRYRILSKEEKEVNGRMIKELIIEGQRKLVFEGQ